MTLWVARMDWTVYFQPTMRPNESLDTSLPDHMREVRHVSVLSLYELFQLPLGPACDCVQKNQLVRVLIETTK